MKKQKESRHMKRKEGKKGYNLAWEEKDVARWRKQAEKENRSLTNLIETVMNNYCK